MGYYLETPGRVHLKAEALLMIHGGQTFTPKHGDFTSLRNQGWGVVCVVNNGPFDAAAFAYSENEFEHFLNEKSGRLKVWIQIPWDVACKESGFSE